VTAAKTISQADQQNLSDLLITMPRFITKASKLRQYMDLSNIKRNQVDQEFVSTPEDFLSMLGMVFTITTASEDQLQA
jgi:hypothetical protein